MLHPDDHAFLRARTRATLLSAITTLTEGVAELTRLYTGGAVTREEIREAVLLGVQDALEELGLDVSAHPRR